MRIAAPPLLALTLIVLVVSCDPLVRALVRGTWLQSQSSAVISEGTSAATTDTSAQVRNLPAQLLEYSFDVVIVDSIGGVVGKHRSRAQYHTERVGETGTIDLVRIPEGTFKMGVAFADTDSAAAEERSPSSDRRFDRFGDESVAMQVPQRTVHVQSFFIGKFEITQSQWRSVAGLRMVARDLPADPSFFKGDDLPVEEITWEEAVEFCARLSRETGRDYRLPSEAEWEYACRASTKTQFSFGVTITPELVNYNGDYPYGRAPKGQNRRQTVRVGSVGWPNEFGLYDMHGNVKEWCMDTWHENYNGAPTDGRVWNTTGGSPWTGCGDDYRVVRGGSWLQGPYTSAHRGRLWRTNNKNYFTGFRVVSSLP